MQWAGTHLPDLFCHLGRRDGELAAHGRREVEHLDALPFQTDLFQQLGNVFHSPFGIEITFQVMTIAFQSTCNHHAVRAVLESPQHIQDIQFASARQFDHLQ